MIDRVEVCGYCRQPKCRSAHRTVQGHCPHWRDLRPEECGTCRDAAEMARLKDIIAGLEAFIPTAESINALPEGIRRYIHDLESRCDPAGDVRRVTQLQDENTPSAGDGRGLQPEFHQGDRDRPGRVPEMWCTRNLRI